MSRATTKLNCGNVTLNDTTPVQIVPANPGRVKLLLQLNGSNFFCALGGNTVTYASGALLAASQSGERWFELETKSDLYGILSTGFSGPIGFIELYD